MQVLKCRNERAKAWVNTDKHCGVKQSCKSKFKKKRLNKTKILECQGDSGLG